MASSTSRPTRLVVVGAAVVLLAAVLIWLFTVLVPTLTASPFTGKSLYLDPNSSVAKAVSSGTSAADLGALPTTAAGIWILPEVHPTSSVTAYVDSLAATANAQGALPVIVIYGIPNRDCNNQSAGGLSEAEYPGWITAIANGLAGHSAAVILEPDSLALASDCNNVDTRVAQIRDAVARLNATDSAITGTDLSIYLDGGHSTWLAADVQAGLLQRAGIENVRGFATNVSNFNSTASEQAYDEQVSSLTGGSHYVIDTSRNGNGTNGEWCNPSGRKLGDTPGTAGIAGKQDANLWIKNPGESDGECNGGPAAGQWWNDGALALVRG